MATSGAAFSTRAKRLGIAALLSLLVDLAIGLPGLHAYTVFFPPRQPVSAPPGFGLPVEDVGFLAVDGVKISGWLIKRQPSKGTIILCHGSGGSRLQMLDFARMLLDGGYNVLMFDYRGNGNSEGNGTSFGYYEVRDFEAAVTFAQSRRDLSGLPIGALGISMGAGVVIAGAGDNPAVKAVVADSVFARLDEVIFRMTDLWLKTVPLRIPEGQAVLALGNLYWRGNLADYRPVDSVAKIAPRAIMLIHSADDNQNTTVVDAKELYQAAGNPKELWIAPGGGHVGAFGAFPDEYRSRVLTFFDSYIR